MREYTPKGYANLTVTEIPKCDVEKIGFDICKQPRETIDSYYKRQTVKPDVLSNAGFFNMSNGNAVGTVMVQGYTYSASAKITDGMGTLDNKSLSFGSSNVSRWKDFIGGYPVLIRNGQKVTTDLAKELNYRARRTCLGFNKDYIYLVCVESPGMNFTQLQNLMLKLGCTHAINLDGGGSTRKLVYGVKKTKLISNRAVDTVFYVKLKPWSGKTAYRYGKGLNIRSGPGTGYKIIGNYVYGTNVTIYEQQGVWGRTSLGWVNVNYVRKV